MNKYLAPVGLLEMHLLKLDFVLSSVYNIAGPV